MGNRPPDEENLLIIPEGFMGVRRSGERPQFFLSVCCRTKIERRSEMMNPRPEKVAVVDELKEKFATTDGMILTEYRGLDVSAMAGLRNALREAGGEYKIYKNTLVRLAAHDAGLEIEDLLVGPTALAFVGERPDGSAGDVSAVAKALREFAKANQLLVVKGGVLGDEPLDSDGIKALAELPSRDVLLAQLAGTFQAPMTKFAGLLSAVPRHFAYALNALIEERGGPQVDTTADETTTELKETEAHGETQDETQTEASADADAGDAGEPGEASQEKEA